MEEEFSIFILNRAKKFFNPTQQNFLGMTRMVKLIAFVAEDIEFDLTTGWYKYGIYPAVSFSEISSQFSGEEERKLTNLKVEKEIMSYVDSEFKDLKSEVDEAIKKYVPHFILDHFSFNTWVYSKKAPEEYSPLYLNHMQFGELVNRFRPFVILHDKDIKLVGKGLKEGYKTFGKYIYKQYENLAHIKDDEILDLFYDYMDLFEMFLLKLKKNRFSLPNYTSSFWEELGGLYLRNTDDLWTLMVPYRETLKGPKKTSQKLWYDDKIKKTKKLVKREVDQLMDKAESNNLLPSTKELQEEIKKKDYKGIREIYSSVE